MSERLLGRLNWTEYQVGGSEGGRGGAWAV